MFEITKRYFTKKMVATTLMYNFGQTVLDSSKRKIVKSMEEGKDPEENQIIESFEGNCEECEKETPKKICPICGE